MSVHDAATQILALHKRHAKEVGDVITKGIQDHARDISDGKVPSTSLLILALPDEYKRPATFADAPSTPVLVLDEIKDGETNRGLLARIVGDGRFEGVNKKIGSRQLFFGYIRDSQQTTRCFRTRNAVVTVPARPNVSMENSGDFCTSASTGSSPWRVRAGLRMDSPWTSPQAATVCTEQGQPQRAGNPL